MSKVDDMRVRYVESNLITKQTFEKFNNGDKTKTKKYLGIMCRFWCNRHNPNNSLVKTTKDIINTIQEFELLLPYIENKDILSYKDDFNQLSEIVYHAKMVRDDKMFIRENHIEVLSENDDLILLRPISHQGSLKYGYNTKWCTASRNNPHTFKSYMKDGFLYYLNIKNKSIAEQIGNSKLAFYIRSYEGPFAGRIDIYDEKDRILDVQKTMLISGSIFEMFYQIGDMIRHHGLQLERVRNSKKLLTDTVKTLKSIDFSGISNSLSNVNNVDPEFIDTFKENIKDVMKQMIKQYE
jgi:hypothetical protein